MIRHLDLFSGLGGFAVAVHQLGHRTIGFCDNEKAAQEFLSLRWPGVPIHDDIKTLTGDLVQQWGGCDLITGGFPCQPFSVAGKRRGTEDDRSLWHEMARVIDECRPRYILGENVPGIISMELDTVITDLESLGYAVAPPLVLPAVATDAPHRRDRVWIMAYSDSGDGFTERSPIPDVADTEGQRYERVRTSRDGWAGPTNSGRRIGEPAPAHAHGAGREEQRWAFTGPPEHASAEQPCWWSPEPGVGRVADGVSRRVDRLRLLGNSIVPAVAYEILRVMLADEPT